MKSSSHIMERLSELLSNIRWFRIRVPISTCYVCVAYPAIKLLCKLQNNVKSGDPQSCQKVVTIKQTPPKLVTYASSYCLGISFNLTAS